MNIIKITHINSIKKCVFSVFFWLLLFFHAVNANAYGTINTTSNYGYVTVTGACHGDFDYSLEFFVDSVLFSSGTNTSGSAVDYPSNGSHSYRVDCLAYDTDFFRSDFVSASANAWPPEPTTLSASQGTQVNQIALSWTASMGATSYEIYRSVNPGTLGNFLASASSATSSYIDTTITNDAPYYYTVIPKAYNVWGSYTNQVTGWRKLSAPASFSATMKSIVNSVGLSWTGVAYADAYNVYRSDTFGTLGSLLTQTASTSYTDATSGYLATYYYTVIPAHAGVSGFASSQEAGQGKTPLPDQVQNVNATKGTLYTKVNVSWSAVTNASSYDLYRSSTASSLGEKLAGNITGTAYDDNSVVGETVYYYTVVSVNSFGNGPNSTASNGWGKNIPVISTLNASKGSFINKISLSWSSASDATGYEVYSSSSSSGATTLLATVTGINYDDITITTSDHYFYTVKVKVGSSVGNASSEAEGWLKLPKAISTLTAKSGLTAKILLQWALDTDATGYEIWRSTAAAGVESLVNTIGPSISYEDKAIESNKLYYYRIKAKYGTRTGQFSNQASGSAMPIPAAPTINYKGGTVISAKKFYVPVGRGVTMLTPSTALPTAEKMKLSITQNGQTAERSQIYSGGLYALTTPSLALFEQRDIKIRFAWENYPDVFTEETITAIGGTKETLRLAIEPAAGSVSDNQTLTVKVKVGEYSKDGLVYAPETMGQWRTQIVAQTNTQSVKTPITAMQDMVNGEATFQINPAGYLFMKLTAISELVTSIPGLNVSLNSLIKYIEVVKGTPIEGTISAKMLEAPAPKSFTLDLNLSQDNRVALKAVSWQESLDSGATWSDIPNSNVVRKSIAMLDPERKKVRVKMINKNTLVESFTAPVELLTYPKLDAVISGPLNTGPGKPVTLRANVYNDGNMISSPVVEWTVISGAGKTNYTGENLTVTEAQEGKLTIIMRARSAITSAGDIDAWAYTRATLVVKNPLTPSIYAVGPREIEVGKTYHFNGSAKPSWGSGASGLNIIFEWELPDGTIKSGYQLDWTPSIDSLSNENPLIYRAWVEGFKDTTTIERTLIYKMWQYVWPTFTMSMKQLTPVAPSDLLLIVNYNQPGMSSRFEGLTYTWSFPTNVTGRQNDAFPNRAAAQALFAGEYDVTVTIQDARGHQTVLTQHIVAEQAASYTATLKVGKSNLFDRVPMTVTVRPTIYGGHPLDSVTSQTWKIDGVAIDEYVNRDYLVSNITGAGNHVISYTINSRMGKTATINSPLTLISNKLPVCLLTATPNAYVVYADAKCTDPDGKVIGYSWQVNGEPIGATSYRISFGKTTTPQSASVTITAMDDAKEYSMPVSITVNY